MSKIAKNHEDWSVPEPPPPPKKQGMLVLSPEDMQEAKKSIKEKGINTKDVKNLPPIEKLCEPTTDPNSISTSDAETEDVAEPEKDNEKNDPPKVQEEEAPVKRKKYTREDFLARIHGKERELWVQKSIPLPGKSLKTKEEEHYNKFCEWMKPLFFKLR